MGFSGTNLSGSCSKSLEAIDERCAVDRFGSILRRGSRSPLLEQVVDVPESDGACLARGSRIDRERQHGFNGTKFDGALNFGRHAVSGFWAFGNRG